MKKILFFLKMNKLTIISIIISFGMVAGSYNFKQDVGAQSISILPTLIGGQTEGVTGVCCDGIILEFSTVNPLNMHLLDGEALWIPGLTDTYDHENEFEEGALVIGSLVPFICLDVEAECESASYMPYISQIGTSNVEELASFVGL